jgi:hypothetical protein
MIRITRTVRGVEVEVIGDSFDGDPSVGIPYGPEQVYAETMDGEHFELTPAEEEQFTVELAEAHDQQSFHDWD